MTVNLNHMPLIAQDYIGQGRGGALATVISTWGSAPRPVGAQLAISGDGAFQGSVSGGCVEGAIILDAQEAIRDGRCRILEYGVADEDAFAVGLACGGAIRILVEPIDVGNGPSLDMLNTIAEAINRRKSYGVSVDLTDFSRKVIDTDDTVQGVTDNVHTQHWMPQLRMMIVGAVHITQHLCVMARMAGYGVSLIDPRESFASIERFPDETFIDAWPDVALEQVGLDAGCAVVTLTHDPKIDTPALMVALKSKAFYIGSLGSKRTHANRVAQLQGAGFSDCDIARIHGPVGLNIGARTPAEIAIAIMGEVTQHLRQAKSKT